MASTTQRSTPSPNASIGKNVAEKRNSGICASVILSKSCQDFIQVVTAMQTAENANAIRIAAGRARTAHHDWVRPISAMTTRKAAE